jgi:hypothetical protein
MDVLDNTMVDSIIENNIVQSSPDFLDRKKVIDDISKMIDNAISSKVPFSLAVTGVWGIGKSFILKEIENKFSYKCIVLHYDCWKKDYYEEPLVGILSSISEKINKIEANNPDRQQKHYYKVMKEVVFQISRGIILHYANFDINKLRKNFSAIKELVKVKKKIEIRSFDSLSNLSDTVEMVNRLLTYYMAYENKKILFVVDELDRCLPDYAIKILNRLHHVCYGTPVIQLVAINEKDLEGSINGLYNRNLQDDFAQRYLDRFFTNYYNLSKGDASRGLIEHCWPDIDDYFSNDSIYDSLGTLSDVVLKNLAIRDKKKLIILLSIYHKFTLGSSKEKYPIELACAELLELFRKFLHIEQNWTVIDKEAGTLYGDSNNRVFKSYSMEIYVSDIASCIGPDITSYIGPIKNYFFERYEKKFELLRSGESEKNSISSSDRIIALFAKKRNSNKEFNEMIATLKNDINFVKCFAFFESFKESLVTYENQSDNLVV